MSFNSWCRVILGCAIAAGPTAQDALAQRAQEERPAIPLQDARGGSHTALRAAADFFLRTEGTGEELPPPAAAGAQKDHIEIESWVWLSPERDAAAGGRSGSVLIEVRSRGASRSVAASTRNGQGRGPDQASRLLRTGDALGTLTLEAHTNDAGQQGWVRYMLHGVRVSAVTPFQRNGRAYERIELLYENVMLQRSGRTPSGIAPAAQQALDSPRSRE